VAIVCENMAKCYRKVGKEKEAEELEARVKKYVQSRITLLALVSRRLEP